MWRKLLTVAIFLLISNAGFQLSSCAHAKPPNVTGWVDVDCVLNWLPSGTQSIEVLRAPLSVDLNSDQPVDPESCYQIPLLGLLFSVPPESPCFDRQIADISDISVVVQSTGPWRSFPKSKAGKRAVCSFTFFKSQQFKGEKIREYTNESAKNTFTDCGQTVYELRIPDPDEHDDANCSSFWTVYKCFPRSGLALCTNDSVLMHQILVRMNKKQLDRIALPRELPEWKEVDQNAQYWGLRHFPQNGPNSPRAVGKIPAKNWYLMPDSQAIGLTFSYDHKTMKEEITYLSSNPNIAKIMRSMVHQDENLKWGPRKNWRSKSGVERMVVKATPGLGNAALYFAHLWMDVFPFGEP